MSALTVFTYSDVEVRTVAVDGEPWFVAADICRILEFRMASDALRALEDDEKGYAEVRTPGGYQRMSIVNESGVYALIFRSRAAAAKQFRIWVTRELLPAIRKTGRYEVALAAPDVSSIGRRELALMVVEAEDRAAAAEQQLAIAGPKASAWDTFVSLDGDHSVEEVAKMLAAAGIKTGRTRLFETLHAWGWIYRYGDHGPFRPIQRYVDRGWLRLKAQVRRTANGDEFPAPPQVRITADGARAIHAKLTAPVQLELVAR